MKGRKSPQKTSYFASYRRRAVCEDCVVEIVGLKLKTPTQSSNQSPPERGTEFSDAETAAQTEPFCFSETLLETRRSSQSPHSSAINAAILARAQTQRLGGGVRSQIRTGLRLENWALRELTGQNRKSGPFRNPKM